MLSGTFPYPFVAFFVDFPSGLLRLAYLGSAPSRLPRHEPESFLFATPLSHHRLTLFPFCCVRNHIILSMKVEQP